MKKQSYQLDALNIPKYKYSFNQKTYDLSLSSSFDSKIGAYRAKENPINIQNKIKSSSSLTLQKLLVKPKVAKQDKMISKSVSKNTKFPIINNPQNTNLNVQNNKIIALNKPKQPTLNYYQSRIAKSFDMKQCGYLVALARQHFQQTIQAIKIGKVLKNTIKPSRQIKLHKKNPSFKTVYLDMDETLIHCDESSNNYTVKLQFPVQGNTKISAGIRVRPYCNEFIKQLSNFAEIIIFTASSPSYADIVLNYLDPNKTFISHRLYRQHCTLQKGYYTKDLRIINRRLQDCVLVDNSGFSFMIQPQNGIPILPYYHFNKDRELLSLLQFLKEILKHDDVREKIKQQFFFHKYASGEEDSKKIFQQNYFSKTK